MLSLFHPLFTDQARLHLGFYSIFLRDWLKVFPREQLLILKTEDYSKDMAGHLKQIYSFLNIGKYSFTTILALPNPPPKHESLTTILALPNPPPKHASLFHLGLTRISRKYSNTCVRILLYTISVKIRTSREHGFNQSLMQS